MSTTGKKSVDDSGSSPRDSNRDDEILRTIQSLALDLEKTRLELFQQIDDIRQTNRASSSLQPAGLLGPVPAGTRNRANFGIDPGIPPIRTDRIDAPKFSGQDPGGWIYRVQSYFDYYNASEHTRLRLVGMLFESPASDWFLYHHNNQLITSWQGLLEAV